VTTNRRFTMAAALVALGCAGLLAQPGLAMSLAPLNVADLVRQSTQIVRGTVAGVTEGIDGNLPYTDVQLKVAEAIRGTSAGTLTFRQFGLTTPRPAEKGRKYVGLVAGTPRYAAGDEVVLFLGPVSKIGFRTTVGLGQGHFILKGGKLRNDFNNANLFKNVDLGRFTTNDRQQSMVATSQGGVAADTFLGLLRQAVSTRAWDAPAAPAVRPGTSAPVSATPAKSASAGGQVHD
jgi:hypothetical protein